MAATRTVAQQRTERGIPRKHRIAILSPLPDKPYKVGLLFKTEPHTLQGVSVPAGRAEWRRTREAAYSPRWGVPPLGLGN